MSYKSLILIILLFSISKADKIDNIFSFTGMVASYWIAFSISGNHEAALSTSMVASSINKNRFRVIPFINVEKQGVVFNFRF